MRELVEERSGEIVGRAAEQAALLGTLGEGGRLVVFVHGIAGVGKSTLLEAFASQARDAGATVVRIDGRMVEPTEPGFLEALGGAVGGSPASAEEAAERLAGLGERVVLIIDTYEVLRLLDGWIRRSFAPALRDNTRLVLAGREPPVAIWHTAPGWSALVLSLPLGNLAESEAEQFLERAGLDPADAPRVNRLARGHPLSLQLAAAAVRARPDAELEDIALRAVLDQLTELYLDVLEPPVREALDAASVVRRITLSLLAAMLPDRAPQDAFERLRALPFIELGHDGLVVHDTMRETVARALAGSDPARYRRYRGAAWLRLQNELPTVAPAELWRYTADMLYLIENPLIREAIFPTTEHAFWLEAATPGDAAAIEAIVRRHEPAAAAEHVLAWWQGAPQGFRVARDREGVVVGVSMLFEPDRVPYGAIEADPITEALARPSETRSGSARAARALPPALAVRGRGRGAVRRAGRLLARCQARLPGAPPRAAPHLHDRVRPRDVRADRRPARVHAASGGRPAGRALLPLRRARLRSVLDRRLACAARGARTADR